MLLLVNARQDDLVGRASGAGLGASIGPTSAAGWTAVWLEAGDELRLTDGHDHLMLEADASGWEWGLVLGNVSSTSPKPPLTLTADRDPSDVETMATALVDTFGPPGVEHSVREALSDESTDLDDVLTRLSDVLDWPPLVEPEPQRSVVLHRGDRVAVRMAASIAGPAMLVDAGDGWVAASPVGDDPELTDPLAAAVSAGDRRRAPTLVLWRDGDACGYQVWRRGLPDSSWTWGSRWRFLPESDLALETRAVASLTAALRQEIDAPLLRALLRRRETGDALAELVELLRLPEVSLTLLDVDPTDAELAGASGRELVERTSARRAWVTAVRSPAPWEDSRVFGRLSAVVAVGTVLAALVCLGMLALGVAVVLSDGAVVDAPRATGDDRAAVAVFGLLTMVLVPLAVRRWRRWRSSSAREDRPVP